MEKFIIINRTKGLVNVSNLPRPNFIALMKVGSLDTDNFDSLCYYLIT